MKRLDEYKYQEKVEAEVTVPYEGDPNDAAKDYNLKIKNQKRNIDDSYDTTFVGKKEDLLKLLDEYGGEDNVLDTMDAPYGRIEELKPNKDE